MPASGGAATVPRRFCTEPDLSTLLSMTTTTSTAPVRDLPRAAARHRRWVTVVVAMAAGIAAWTVLHPFMGVDLEVRTGGDSVREVSQLAVALTSLVVGLAGWATLAALERFTRRPRTVWTVVAAAVLTLSLLGPLGAPAAGAKAGLVVLHLVVGGVLLFGLARTARRP
jgi:uncharacterized protein DUF6069